MTNFWTQHSWLSRLFLMILILGLSLFSGIDRVFRKEFRDQEVVRVGKDAITVKDVLESFQREARFSESSILKPDVLIRSIIQNKTTHLLLKQEEARLGLKVSSGATQARVRQMSIFKHTDASFSLEKFKRFLKITGISEQEFLQERQKQLVREQLVRALTPQLTLPTPLTTCFNKGISQHRKGKIYEFLASREVVKGEPSEKECHDIFMKHRHAFVTSEKLSGNLVVLTNKDIKPDKISAKDLDRRYEIYRKNLKTPPLDKLAFKRLRDNQSIKAKEKERQATLVRALDESDDLYSLAQALAVSLQNFVITLPLHKGEMPDIVKKWPGEAQQGFLKALKAPGGLQEMVAIDCGHGIRIVCDEVNLLPPQPLSFSQAKAKIKGLWLQEQKNLKAHQRAEQSLKNTKRIAFKPVDIPLRESKMGDILENFRDMSVGEKRLIQTDVGSYILELVKISEGPPLSAAFRDTIYDNMLKEIKNDFINSYLSDLRRYYPISLNEDVLKKLIGAIASPSNSPYTSL